MGAINISLEAIRSSGSLQISVTLVVLLAYPLSQAIYNIWFHPLARIPGPTIWCASRIPFVYNLLTGKLIQRQRQLHDQYGDIFRMAPDEVSFANEEAWNDIYAWRKGHKRAIRDDVFSVAPKGQADNLITTSNVKFHARVRDLMSNSFTDDALNQQSPIIEGHADMFIHQLWCAATSADHGTKGGLVNLTDWLNFFTMDVIGDLAFGESFGCLVNGEYHEWVRTLYGFLKAMSYAAAPRYWPTLQFLLEKMIPRRVMENQRRHQQYANHKINHRLDSKTQRPDFVTPFMNANPNFQFLSREEMISSFSFIIVGGSETSATVMTGIFNHLCMPKNRAILARLTKEIRLKYETEEMISHGSLRKADHPYLEAVLQEGLRFCHPVPSGLPRMVPGGGDEYAGVYLPGGTRLGVRTFTVNRSSRYFHQPDTFVPERWLPVEKRPIAFQHDLLSASKPFSIGFHSCLGKPLALAELRLIVTRVLWAFDLAEEDGKHVDFDNFPTMMMVEKQALMLRLRARDGVIYKGPKFGRHTHESAISANLKELR